MENESKNSFRKILFGLRIRDADQYLHQLRDRIRYIEQLNEYVLNQERSKLHHLLKEEDELWDEILNIHQRLTSSSEPSIPIPEKTPLGKMLIETNAISEKQLAVALDYQELHGGRLGDILVDLYQVDSQFIEQIVEETDYKYKLGELLLKHGLITNEQLEEALIYQQRSGGQIGEILTSLNMVDPEVLYKLIAMQNKMGRVGKKLVEDKLPKIPEQISREYNAIIIGERDHRHLVAVGLNLRDDQVQNLEQLLGKQVEQVLATPREMQMYRNLFYSEEQMKISTYELLEDQPNNSAYVTFTKGQIITFCSMFILISAFILIDWKTTLITLNTFIQLFYFVMICFKGYILMKGADRDRQMTFTDNEIFHIDERKLPIYTILIPMYKEANIIPQLIDHLERLDYPKFKLDIRLLLEEDDVEAIDLIKNLQLPSYYTMIIVPYGLPKTKPKACNYGLIHARGEYVVIYDAEDRPDKYQLKKAIAAFSRLPKHYVCMQAKLNYFNSEQNLLTRWFTQEYSIWFELLLPGLMKLDIPIPLGGTSNHFKMNVLKGMQAWDPFNVTEDADLGIRLYKQGYKTAIMDSITWEEANSQTWNWIRQRSRWIKGYMQTWLVHMRNPFQLLKEVGVKGFWGIQAMILATPALPLINPIFWLLVILWYGWQAELIPTFFPGPIYYISAVLFIFGNFVFIYSNAVGMHWVIQEMHRRKEKVFSYRMVKHALLTPIYWVLMSMAGIRALWQLITKPYYWEKTEHGLTKDTPAPQNQQQIPF